MPDPSDRSQSEECRNIELVKEYMMIAYDPQRASAEAVTHLCAPRNSFTAPTTFPNVHTLEEYAEEHGKLMQQIDDLRLISFDILFASGPWVGLRYTAEGSHSGAPHGAILPTGRKARWTAAAMFRVEAGKLAEFVKEWDKLAMWSQLGWPLEECLAP